MDSEITSTIIQIVLYISEELGIWHNLKYNFNPTWHHYSFIRESGIHEKEKNIDWKKLDEFDTDYFENKFIEVLEDIRNFKIDYYKIKIIDTLPVPYMFLLGYLKQTNKNLGKKSILHKLKTNNSWGKEKVDYFEDFKGKKDIIILISESKAANKEAFDFNIKCKKQFINPSRSSFNKKSYEQTLISVMNRIHKLDININKIRLKIVASPLVSFATGEILAKHNFLITVDHYSFSVKKSKEVVQIRSGYHIDFI